jgi:hypothetical protein
VTGFLLPGRSVGGADTPSRLSDEDLEALVERSEALARDLRPEQRELTEFERLVAMRPPSYDEGKA